jgi:hypothetical protein
MNPNLTNKDFSVNDSVYPSGISHSFDTGYAIAYGVDEAIMIRNLQFFITANANRGHNFYEGRYWTYDRLEDFPNHFPYWTLKQIRRILASLVEQGIIIKGEFNNHWSNRTQWYAFKDQDKFIKHVKTPKTPLPIDPDLPKWATDRCPNQQLTDVDSGNCIYGTSTITDTITTSNTPPTPKIPDPPDPPASPVSACADGVCASQSLPVKKPRTKSEFLPKVRELATRMINCLMQHNPVYRPPDDMTKFLTQVQLMLEKDGQDVETIMRTFEWAAKDSTKRGDFSGWQGVIATNTKGGRASNPAEIFRKHFAKIHAQMKSQPERKFAPSSNHEATMKIVEEMNKRAL